MPLLRDRSEVEFEQPQPKMWMQGEHALGMLYGDGAAQAEVTVATEITVAQNGISDGGGGEIVALCGANLVNYGRRSAEGSLLDPSTITSETFPDSHPSCITIWLANIRISYGNIIYDSGLYRGLTERSLIRSDVKGRPASHICQVEYGQLRQQVLPPRRGVFGLRPRSARS